ncbi:MAG: hypothetical protein AB7O26_00110 [Planctomycetaceae bacterium]
MIVTCPRCSTRYRPYGEDYDYEETKKTAVDNWIKVVCPVCEQWVRLNDGKKIPPPNVAPEYLQQAKAQAEIVEDGEVDDEPRKSSSRTGSATVSGRCPECRAKFRAPGKFAGKSVKCPRCKGSVPIPEIDTEDWGDAGAWEPMPSSSRSHQASGGLAGVLDFANWPPARKYWALGSSVAILLVIGCAVAFSYGKKSAAGPRKNFTEIERHIHGDPPAFGMRGGIGPAPGQPFPPPGFEVRAPKHNVKYSPGDRVRAKFAGRIFAAEVVEQLTDNLVQLRSLGIEEGEPARLIEKGNTIAIRVDDILP